MWFAGPFSAMTWRSWRQYGYGVRVVSNADSMGWEGKRVLRGANPLLYGSARSSAKSMNKPASEAWRHKRSMNAWWRNISIACRRSGRRIRCVAALHLYICADVHLYL